MMRRSIGLLLVILVGCAPVIQEPTPRPTRQLSAPTLAPSPTTQILLPEQIYPDPITDGQTNPTAAALPVDAGLPPLPLGTLAADGAQLVQVVLEDGTQLNGELYENALNERRPAVLLLSVERSNWAALPSRLLDEGYTVLALEFPNPRPQDVPAFITAIIETATVDPSRLAIIATASTTDATLIACADEPLCRSLILLSPQTSPVDALNQYQPRPLLIITAQDDTAIYNHALTLSNAPNASLITTEAGRGTGLLINPAVLNGILAFLRGSF